MPGSASGLKFEALDAPRSAPMSRAILGGKHGRAAMSTTYRIEFMNGGERVKTMDLTDEPLEEAIEVAQAGMEEYQANFARIMNTDGVEVWNGRNDALRP
jgi:hypothetical protein